MAHSHIPEVLAPAGNIEKLRVALLYGADAVYFGGPEYSLRAHATLNRNDLQLAIKLAHDKQVKAYVTVNIFAHNRDLNRLPDYLLFLQDAGADAVIVADPGILWTARKTVPDMPLHLSTQANITNVASARFWQEQGVSRLNLARELSLAELTEIARNTALQIEVFVHGALCISYSGRCLLSYYFTGRDANQGNCAHPCRYNYTLLEEKRPGQQFPVEEDGRGTYIFNSKDLCLLNRLPDLIKAGVHSIKIEGRMKSPYYVGGVVRVYRAALDQLKTEMGREPDAGKMPPLPPRFMAELNKIGTRGYSENFFSGSPGAGDMLYEGGRTIQTHIPAGIVKQGGDRPVIEIRNQVFCGDSLEYLEPGLTSKFYTIDEITDVNGSALEKANPGNLVNFTTSPPIQAWQENSLLRKPVSPQENK